MSYFYDWEGYEWKKWCIAKILISLIHDEDIFFIFFN